VPLHRELDSKRRYQPYEGQQKGEVSLLRRSTQAKAADLHKHSRVMSAHTRLAPPRFYRAHWLKQLIDRQAIRAA